MEIHMIFNHKAYNSILDQGNTRIAELNGNITAATGLRPAHWKRMLKAKDAGNVQLHLKTVQRFSNAMNRNLTDLMDPLFGISIRPTLVTPRAPTQRYQISLFN